MAYELFATGEAVRPHSVTAGEQRFSEIAALADGGAVVVWSSQQDPDQQYGYDVMARRYDAQGNAVGAEMTVFSGPADSSGASVNPTVAGLTGGGYAISFKDPATRGMTVVTYDAEDTKVAEQVVQLPQRVILTDTHVDVTVSASGYGYSAMAELADGGFSVTWSAGYAGALAQYAGAGTEYSAIFDANGTMTTAPFQITPWIASISYGYDLYNYLYGAASLEDGNYVVVTRIGTTTPGNDSGFPSVGVQIFDPQGAAVAGPFLAASIITEDMGTPAVAGLKDGSFVVAWNSETATMWRQFAADGTPMGTEESLGGLYDRPTVSAMEDGGFIIGLRSQSGYNPSFSAYAFRFDADGEQVGERQQIHTRADAEINYIHVTPEFVTLGNGALLGMWNGHASWNGDVSDIVTRTYLAERIGTSGDDTLTAAATGTAFFAGDGNDGLTGSAYADVLDAGAGNDTAMGMEGDDTLIGGTGDDYLDGGSGTDTVVIAAASTEATRVGLSGGGAGAMQLQSPDGLDWITGDVEYVEFSDMTLTYAEASALGVAPPISGTDAGEIVPGTSGDDSIVAGGGDDVITPGEGNDTVDGGTGVDTLSYDEARGPVFVSMRDGTATVVIPDEVDQTDTFTGIENITGTRFADVIAGDGKANLIDGGNGNDRLVGGRGSDDLSGGRGKDFLKGDGGGDILSAGGGNDTVVGGGGKDILLGGRGNDVVNGGRGDDVMMGNAGRDTFVMNGKTKHDTIMDFELAKDTIDISAEGLSFDDLSIRSNGGDAKVIFGGGDYVILEEIAKADIDASIFDFG